MSSLEEGYISQLDPYGEFSFANIFKLSLQNEILKKFANGHWPCFWPALCSFDARDWLFLFSFFFFLLDPASCSFLFFWQKSFWRWWQNACKWKSGAFEKSIHKFHAEPILLSSSALGWCRLHLGMDNDHQWGFKKRIYRLNWACKGWKCVG